LPRTAVYVVIMVGVFVVGIGVGIAIGRATTDQAAPTPAAAAQSQLGQLAVTSKPTDGNVTVDGRFVGVSPNDRLDLDAATHTVVIDAFGYQPYAGSLAIEAHGKLNLKVLLAPIGGTAATSGDVSGTGKVIFVPVPASALLPANASAVAKPAAPAPRQRH